jgi:hypothetical protein
VEKIIGKNSEKKGMEGKEVFVCFDFFFFLRE